MSGLRGTELGDPFRIDSKISEEIPEPQPTTVIEYKIEYYRCPCCQKEVVATMQVVHMKAYLGITQFLRRHY